MKVRRQLQRRVAASAERARINAAWVGQFFPTGWLKTFPLQGRVVAAQPRGPL